MAGDGKPSWRWTGGVVAWLTAAGAAGLGGLVVLGTVAFGDLNRPLQFGSVAGLEQRTELKFPEGTRLVVSRLEQFQDVVVAATLEMSEAEAREMLRRPPFDGELTEKERLVTDQDWALNSWGPTDPQWRPDAAKRFVCAQGQVEGRSLYARVLVDLDRAPQAGIYLVWVWG
jgi:hypothetical protein